MAIKFLNTATAATQAVGDNSTKIATTAYADAAASAIPIGNYLPLSAGSTKPLTGPLYIPHYIYHVGDAGTFIGFPANDRLIIGTNGGTRVDITNSGFCLGDSGSNISVSTILDEDDMASDSATALVTQQSIKAYVDAQTPGAGVFLPLAGGTMNTNAAITMSGSLTTSANVYAQRFYDQGDNSFYGDFEGTSQFNHVKINSTLSTRNFVSGSYGWQLEQSTTTTDPVTFRFDNQKYRVFAGGGAGEIMTFLEGGNIGIGNTNPSSALSISKSMGAAFIADFINPAVNGHGLLIQAGGTTGTRYITQWKDALGTERFHMEDDGEAYFQGNVGIGTTSPGASLHVATDGAAGTFRLSPQDGTYEDYRLDIRAQASNAGALTMKLKDNTFLKTYGYYNLTGVSHGVAGYEDLLHLKNNGNVGIGTTNPSARLNISGTGTGAAIDWTNTTIATGRSYRWVSLNAGGFAIEDLTASGAERMRISSTGNVGIGTTIPYGKLDVAGNIRLQSANQIYFGGTGSIPYWSVGVDNTTNNNFVIGGSSYYSGDRDILLNPVNNGNVGIGTTSPSEKLQVVGNTLLNGIKFNTGYGQQFISAGTGTTINFGQPTSYVQNIFVQGTIEASSSVQMGNNTAAASSANAGSTRYRVSGNNSYMDMSMRTGATTYAWVNIVQNNW